MANYYEVSEQRTLNQIGKDEWTGTRTFLCQDYLVANISRSLWNQPFPAMLFDLAPRVYKTATTYEAYGVKDTALLVAYYRSKPIPGKAVIHTRASYKRRYADIDVKGKIITGIEPRTATADKHTQEWKIVQGDNIVFDSSCDFIVQTAIARADYSDENLIALQNSVNASRFNIRGNAAAGTLLFKGYESIDRYSQDPIEITYHFGYDPAGWNSHLLSQLGTWKVRSEEVDSPTGVALGRYRDVLRFHPGKDENGNDTVPQARQPRATANWGAIRDNASW